MRINCVSFVRIGYGHCRTFRMGVNEILFASEFYIPDSVHRDSSLIRTKEMQHYAGVYLLQNYSACFGCLSHPSSGVHQTVTAASGTVHITCQSEMPVLYRGSAVPKG